MYICCMSPPPPSVSYVVRTEGFNCGIMISASHNPFYDNGIKVINEKGEKLEESVILEVEKYLDGEMERSRWQKGTYWPDRGLCSWPEPLYRIPYIHCHPFLQEHEGGPGLFQRKRVRHCQNVFDALGAETHVMNNEPNGLNINTDCGSTHIEHLQKFVADEKCDIGFAL